MAKYESQMAMDFFFAFDNATNGSWEKGKKVTFDAEGPVNSLGQAFYKLSTEKFKEKARDTRKQSQVITDLTAKLVVEHLDDFGENLQLAFEDFAQGVLFDQRRNIPKPYGFWPVHSMDSIYEAEAKEFGAKPIPATEYYIWYGTVRGQSVASDSDSEIVQQNLLHFGRYIALAAAVQNVAKPKRIVGPSAFNPGNGPPTPYSNADNKPIARDTLKAFRDRYLPMSFEDLDKAFKTSDGGRLGPLPK